MDNINTIKYFSLDEARIEIKKRWNNLELREIIKKELGDNFISFFDLEKPRSVVFRQLITPDNGLYFFYQESNYINTNPTVFEFLDDMFVSFNEEKKAYGRLYVNNRYIDIISFYDNERKMIKDIITKKGESVVDFHHSLIVESRINIDIHDMSFWFKKIGKAKDYYYYFLLHFVVFGVLFETFTINDEEDNESGFTKEIVLPSINKIYKKFNLEPIIIKMYPDNQTKEEDLYWWSYPDFVNEIIINKLKSKNYIN